MNPYESGARKNIPAVLIYARAGGRVLMIHRDAQEKPGDYHAGKWNGLGGKCELDESAWESASREFREEAGLHVDPIRFHAVGLLQFPNFKAHKSEDWTVFVFVVDLEDAEAESMLSSSDEGSLHWIAEGDVSKLNLWPGDRHFISWVLERKRFMGTIWYREQEVIRHEVLAF